MIVQANVSGGHPFLKQIKDIITHKYSLHVL